MTGIDTPLRCLRIAAGLTQAQLAAASGVNPRQIQRIELGTSKAENLTLKNAVALASALGVKPEDLMEVKKMKRFAYHGHPGQHPNEAWLANLTDKELATKIRNLGEWDADLLYDLCWRADMQEEYDAAGDDFETVAYAAAEKLGVEI